MRGAYITVCERLHEVILLYNNKRLDYKTFDKHNRPKQPVSAKELNPHFDQRKISRKSKPKPNHPWYSGFADQIPSKTSTYPQPS
jgi:hypothetical protein